MQGLKGRLALVLLTNDESKWDDNACQWNEMRFNMYDIHSHLNDMAFVYNYYKKVKEMKIS